MFSFSPCRLPRLIYFVVVLWFDLAPKLPRLILQLQGGSNGWFALQVSPMDVSKTRLQVIAQGSKGMLPSISTVMKDIIKTDGVSGLYAG